jgi:hypothetical protein
LKDKRHGGHKKENIEGGSFLKPFFQILFINKNTCPIDF